MCSECGWNSPWIAQQEHGILLHSHQGLNATQRIPEDELRAIQRAKEVAYHGKLATNDVLKQDRRTSAFADAPMNLSGLKIRADRNPESQKLTVPFQITNTFLQTGVAHEKLQSLIRPQGPVQVDPVAAAWNRERFAAWTSER